MLSLSYSNVKRDSRVIKHDYFFKKNGYENTLIGFENEINWNFSFKRKILALFNYILNREKTLKYIYPHLENFEKRIPENIKFDVVICNDWITLPLAVKIKKRDNAKLIYDSHEMYTRQFEQSLKWRLLYKPLVEYIEKKYINSADMVTAVSEDIGKDLKQKYDLHKVEILHNIPLYSSQKTKIDTNINYPIKLYHHGIFNKSRGILNLANAVKNKSISKKFELHLRLIGDIDKIKTKYSGENIFVHDPMPVDKMVYEASKFDIGISMVQPINYNYRYCMPNKFFEYIYAGIPVIVSEQNISMARVVKKYDIGFITHGYGVKSITTILKKIKIKELGKKRENLIKVKEKFNAKKEWNKIIQSIK